MSDSFSVAMVTSALCYILNKEGIKVSAKSPDSMTEPDNQVNIYLYQITPNLGYRNMDLPARGYSGNVVTNQQLGLDLHYLVSAYTENNADDLAAHKLLGEVTRLLHENPILTRDMLKELIEEADTNPGNLPHNLGPVSQDIATSDLAKQVELVKLTMQTLSLEDMTKLWSSFFKTGTYRISVSYKATVVLIDGKHEADAGMPVRERNVYAIAPKKPEITYIEPQLAEFGAQTVKIAGKHLKADNIRVDFGEGKEIGDMDEPMPNSVADEEMEVDVSSLKMGVHQIRVVHSLSIGTPEVLHKGPQSNIALFAIVPKFAHTVNPSEAAIFDSATRKLTLKVEPGIKTGQKVEVILGTQKAIGVTIESEPVSEIEVNVASSVSDGAYPVRFRVDGAEAQPDEYFGDEYMRPVVAVE